MDQKAELVKLLDQRQEYGIDANRPDLDMPCIDNDEVADHLIANGVAVLSHVMLLEVDEDYGSFQISKVILYNENHATQEEALRIARAGEYHPSVLILPKRQWASLFLDRKEDLE